MGITECLLKLRDLLLCRLDLVLHVVYGFDVVARHFSLLLPFDTLLLMLAHLVAVEVQLLVHGLRTR